MRFTAFVSFVAFANTLIAAPLSADSDASLAETKWDVIVVGAGPAGIIVADRMAEAGKKTLLLEDGGPSYGITGGTERPSWLSGTKLSRVDVPGLYKSIFSNPSPTMLCTGKTNAFGGCTIGGSSAINAGLFFQPPQSDFDNYFPNGWKFADVQSAIQKLNQRQTSSAITSENHKRYLQHGYAAAKDWLVKGAGYKETNFKQSPNVKTKVFGHPIFDYDNGQRGGPVISYLQKALQKKNFHMSSNTRAVRVVRDGGKATGVIVNKNGGTSNFHLSPNGRVIISGGALQSPALLMKSGIGDPATLKMLASNGHLQQAPHTWINNSAIGDRLFDNPNTFIELRSKKVKSYVYSYDSPKASDAQLYVQKRSGPYSFASETSAFWDTVKHKDGSHSTMQGTIDSAGFSGFQDDHTITLNVYGTSGLQSTGRVELSQDAIPGPSGDVYYSHPRDAQDIATFIQRIFKALHKSSLTSLNIDENSSHSKIVDYITQQGNPYTRGQTNHWSSSCRFGKCVDIDTVVKGTKNIHVVDGSIVPPLSVNPQMGIMIAAERASERILAL